MSQYPSMPPPGAYVPPNQNQNTPPPQGYGAQHQQQGYQQLQGPTTYQSSAQGHGQPSQSHKASGGTFGQMMNQAVTTSKPMLNKLSKTISSKLGNKPTTSGNPQHMQSYQNYQQHYGQQTQVHSQPQSHTFNPQAQQTQQHPQPQAPSTYPPQQSPYQQSNYGSGQGNYFTQQAPTTPQTPYTRATPPPQQPLQTSYNSTQFDQGGNTVGDQQAQAQQGQYHHGQISQAHTQTQGQYQQQPLQAQYTGQQMGVMGGSQHVQQSSNPQSPQISSVSPSSSAPQQTQWHNSHTGSEQSLASTYQQPQHQQQQPPASTAHTQQSYFPNTNVQAQPNNQQWTPLSPAGSEGQGHSHSQLPPASISPPPPPPVQSKPQAMPSVSPQQSHGSTPAPQSVAAQPGPPTEFIAELPADMGSLSIAETKPLEHAPVPVPGQASPYQAYESSTAQAGPSSPGFTIARRAVSISNVPYADPWRFADPLTELPTREFYIIADLLFDALDRKFEPQNTGMLEASKILRSWIDLTEDATQLFSYNSYSAFGKMWSLQGIPHVMVPCQPSLTPIWNFNQHSHAHELKLSPVQTNAATYATYMPALNRAGWYMFFFLEMMHGPDNINKLMPAFCSETYKPGVLHHPDLTKRDKAEAPALQARAAEIQTTAINQVCNETKATILAESNN
ncbi:hypothetical protein BU25DRAFT_85423 [Macroventuria anomochaeta]|uniref:Uncharacterized protein n=1 Tax=Macroventuria anomochaeta TaxID=301207 RepID=A0ACB6SF92_9PLEO|nr:uncharacterized protein BU25DRAFT_85423 [Macroventuria anomochaeta]KAF2632896.1 hypothetical protein BU25DRAFT_85423 [Macroventuria anomochaeta]